MERQIGSGSIGLQLGDITQVKVDAVVTAANRGLKGGGGVDAAVHKAAGPKLLAACQTIGNCLTGSAVITPAFELKSQGVLFVIHAVGPIWRSGKSGEAENLKNAYRQSLALASQHNCVSIAFPSISTGVYRYPVEHAAPLALSVCREFLSANPVSLQKILFVLFDRYTLETYQKALGFI